MSDIVAVHNGRKYKVFSKIGKLPKDLKRKDIKKDLGYLYFIRIGEENERLFKIGTTNRPLVRMLEHARYFQKEIVVLWFSPQLSKYTTLRIEDRQKNFWIENKPDWKYLENDRFIIPSEVHDLEITIKKNYSIRI